MRLRAGPAGPPPGSALAYHGTVGNDASARPPLLLEVPLLTGALLVPGVVGGLVRWGGFALLGVGSGVGPGLVTSVVRWELLQAAALALLMRRAPGVGAGRLFGEALLATVVLIALQLPLAYLATALPKPLGGQGDPDGAGRLLEQYVQGWLSPWFALLIGCAALGLFLGARGRGRWWQGLGYGAPGAAATVVQMLAVAGVSYAVPVLLEVLVIALLVPPCVRVADRLLGVPEGDQ